MQTLSAGNPILVAEVSNSPNGFNVPQYVNYNNNIVLTNSNFKYLAESNRQLNLQIATCNSTISSSNSHISNLEARIATLNTELNNNNISQQEMRNLIQQLRNDVNNVNNSIRENTNKILGTEREIRRLVNKVDVIVNYIPPFVKSVSKWFVNLLLGVKTNTLDEINFVYDTKMIEAL